MKRKENDLNESKLFFYKAKALKSGMLRMPEFAPNLLKGKKILQKAGDYFVSKPQSQLTVLLHLLIRNKSHPDNPRVTYTEKYVLWTWNDDDKKILDKFLRTYPEGMCRHTRLELQHKRADGDQPRRDQPVYHTNGICTRNECQIMTTDQLLMTYLNFPLSDEQRQQRYKDLRSKFSDMEEFILVDPDDARFKGANMIVRGIEYRTLRWPGNSNGIKSYVFQVVNHAYSVAEDFKNNMRPVFFQSKRASTKRELVVRQFASEDRDTLVSWQTLIADSLVQRDYNQLLVSTYEPAVNEMDRKPNKVFRDPKSGEKDIEFNYDSQKIHDLFLTGVPNADPGMDFETVTGHIYTNLEIKDLFKHLIVVKNEFDMSFTVRFDKYVMGTLANEFGYESFMNLQSYIDPPMATNTVSKHYGYNKQSFLVRAAKEEKVKFENWVEKNMWAPAKFAHGKFKFVRQFANFIAGITVGATEDFEDDPNFHEEVKLMKRNFNLKKSFYSSDKDSEKMNNFCVVYHSIGAESDLDESQEMKMNSADFNADLHQVLLKVEDITAQPGVLRAISTRDSQNFTEKDYEELLRNKPGVAKTLLRAIQQDAHVADNDHALAADKKHMGDASKVVHHVVPYPLFHDINALSCVEEKLYDMLSQNTKEHSRMAIFRYLNLLLGESCQKLLEDNEACVLRNVYLRMIDVAYNTLKDTKRLVVVKQGFSVFEKLLTYGKGFEKDADNFAKCDWHNVAHFKFIDVVEYLISCNYIDMFGFNVMEKAFKVLEYVLKNSGEYISKVSFDSIDRFADILSHMEAEFSYVETKNSVEPERLKELDKHYQALRGKYGKLKELKDYYKNVIIRLLRRKEAIAELDAVLLNPDEKILETPAIKARFQDIKIPYTVKSKSGSILWKTTKYNVGSRGFEVEGKKEPLSYKQVRNQLHLFLPPGLTLQTKIKDTFYPQKRGQDQKIVTEEWESLWNKESIRGEYHYAGHRQHSSASEDDLHNNKANVRFVYDKIMQDAGYFMERNKRLLNAWASNGHQYSEQYQDSRAGFLSSLYVKLGELNEEFDRIDDEKTKISFSIIGNAQALFGKNMIQKYTDLGAGWCESIVKDIVTGFQNVKMDRMFPKSKELMNEMANCERYVNNQELKFFFRPTDNNNFDGTPGADLMENENSWAKIYKNQKKKDDSLSNNNDFGELQLKDLFEQERRVQQGGAVAAN